MVKQKKGKRMLSTCDAARNRFCSSYFQPNRREGKYAASNTNSKAKLLELSPSWHAQALFEGPALPLFRAQS